MVRLSINDKRWWIDLEWAKDPRQNMQHVRASDSIVIKGRRYKCPNCGSPVVLRKGYKRVAYFAHVSGTANPTCKLYNPMSQLSHTQYELDNLPYKIPVLFLRIFDEEDGSCPWQLEIHLPEPDSITGSLVLPFAMGGTRVVPLRNITSGGMRIAVTPQILPYIVEQKGTQITKWTSRLRVIPALSPGVNVFSYSSGQGRMLSEGSPLKWGGAYSLIWRRGNPLNLWLGAEAIGLQAQETWLGALITLPKDRDERIEYWVNTHLARKIVFQKSVLSLISPLPLRQLDDGTVVIPENYDVIIEVIQDRESPGNIEIYVATNEIRRFRINGGTQAFKVVDLQQGRVDLWLREEHESLLQLLRTSDYTPRLTYPKVSFVVHDSKNGFIDEINMHSRNAAERLGRITKCNNFLKEIILPTSVTLRLLVESHENMWKIVGEWTLRNIEQAVDSINLFLFDRKQTFRLDAGSFGNLVIEGQTSSKTAVRVEMSRRWRAQAKWMIALSNPGFCQYQSKLRSLFKSVEFERLHSLDRKLIQSLDRRSFPKEIQCHVLSLISQCQMKIRVGAQVQKERTQS